MTPDQILQHMTRTDPTDNTTLWRCPCGAFSGERLSVAPPAGWLERHAACVERPAVCPVCLLADDGHTHYPQRVDWVNGEPPTAPTTAGYEHTPKDLPPLAVTSLVEAVEANTEAVRELSAAIRAANEQSAGLRAFLSRAPSAVSYRTCPGCFRSGGLHVSGCAADVEATIAEAKRGGPKAGGER